MYTDNQNKELEQVENLLVNFTIEDRDEVTELAEKCIFDNLTGVPRCLKQNAKEKDALVKHITDHGGYNWYPSDTIFILRNASAFADCIDYLPDWTGKT
ncbi:hypothetical protein GLOIN_2v1545527 [Rhizophagus clarus]|uniref:Uncharacterized protein n=1 Tax=Rhizophagus clarus TaxID=94130 RepID=A0A8H3L219_9GLOM|nr:hypothetical protein GLOIN_2v1545527 [Rhizophagus clarus]